jgi:hypothetical protein
MLAVQPTSPHLYLTMPLHLHLVAVITNTPRLTFYTSHMARHGLRSLH